jgi:ribokinase
MTIGERRVLVAGAINTDLVVRVRTAPEAGETITGLVFNVFGGGKGANQALSAARSGAPTTMLGALGSDDFGSARLADLRADGIDVDSIAIIEGVASGVALITVEASGQNRIAYVPGATSRVTVQQAASAFDRAKPAIVLSTLELPHEVLKALFTQAKSAECTVIVNATPEPAQGKDLVPLADVLIVNETEANELLEISGREDWEPIARALQALGPETVIITLGEQGAIGLIGDRLISATAPKVDAIDSTGAGDAFCGAFAARLAEGTDPVNALQAAVAAGSLSVTVEGAQRSMPRRAEIDALLAKMR